MIGLSPEEKHHIEEVLKRAEMELSGGQYDLQPIKPLYQDQSEESSEATEGADEQPIDASIDVSEYMEADTYSQAVDPAEVISKPFLNELSFFSPNEIAGKEEEIKRAEMEDEAASVQNFATLDQSSHSTFSKESSNIFDETDQVLDLKTNISEQVQINHLHCFHMTLLLNNLNQH